MLEITKDNILNWLEFLLQILPLTREEEMRLVKYLRRTDKKTRAKEIEELFGG
jgi:hypothetical protein